MPVLLSLWYTKRVMYGKRNCIVWKPVKLLFLEFPIQRYHYKSIITYRTTQQCRSFILLLFKFMTAHQLTLTSGCWMALFFNTCPTIQKKNGVARLPGSQYSVSSSWNDSLYDVGCRHYGKLHSFRPATPVVT